MNKDELQMQINRIYEWFFEYDNQIKQYERNTRLGIVGTYHIGDNEYTIEELDNLACQKASQIRDLREQIKQIESNE